MISSENKSDNIEINKQDFTLSHYRELLKLASKNYRFVSYSDPIGTNKSILWRHDVDLSLNRAFLLAKIEHEESVKATYFVNPHSEFYNLAEKSQVVLLKSILALGHDLGLHLDMRFYDFIAEGSLDPLIMRESDYLESLCGIRPVAFSFHNPEAQDLIRDNDKSVSYTHLTLPTKRIV